MCPASLRRLARLCPVVGIAAILSACQMFGGGDRGAKATTAASAKEKPIDIRRYLGPDYCPELRVRTGTEVARKYEAGHDGEPGFVVWQASIGKTARECLYDGQGGLTLKVGVSGRVAAGPKGGPGVAASLPLRIALVKYKEAILANELLPLSIAIPPENSIVFNEVRELNVPSPGEARDFILLIGFDEKGEGLLEAKPVLEKPKPVAKPRPAVIAESPPRQRRAPAKPQAQPQEPNVLPVPSSGFVLPGG